jgi:hypothetical protein
MLRACFATYDLLAQIVEAGVDLTRRCNFNPLIPISDMANTAFRIISSR